MSSPESNVKKSENNQIIPDSISCDHRCMHQGDRICYKEETEKETVKKIPDITDSTSSESTDEGSLHSGESLFKTFTFETQDPNNSDLEKCMSFWKTILAKNLKPIKCTLLKKEKVVKQKSVRKNACDQEETKKVWLDVYKDLQRRQLDKVKLVKKEKCDPCMGYTDEEYEKKEDEEGIKKLNEWNPQKEPPHASKIDVKSQIKRTLQVLKDVRSSEEVMKSKEGNASTRSSKKLSKKSLLKSKVEEKDDNPTSNFRNEAKDKGNSSQVIVETTASLSPAPPQTAKLTIIENDPEIQKIQEKDIIVIKQDSGIFCKCGCDTENCICDELSDCFGDPPSPGDPTKEKLEQKVCFCGCGMEGCICEAKSCTCGCGITECTCQSLGNKECPCGCGLDECMCQQLFTRTCKCGHSNCDCDMIKTLSAYLSTLETPLTTKSLRSEKTQTEQVDETYTAVPKKEDNYCIICGHFNCYCNDEKCVK